MLFILHFIKLLPEQNKIYREVPTSTFNCLNNCYIPKRLCSKNLKMLTTQWLVMPVAAVWLATSDAASAMPALHVWTSESPHPEEGTGDGGSLSSNPRSSFTVFGLVLYCSLPQFSTILQLSDRLPPASRDKNSGEMCWISKIFSIIKWARERCFNVGG